MGAKDDLQEVRIDRWLWAVRIFKTRTIATEACKKSRVSIKGITVKPSRTVEIGDIIEVRKPPVVYSFEVLNVTDKRMGAKLVPDFMKDITPPSQLEVLQIARMNGFIDRARGTGRPTKKERRDIDDFTDGYIELYDWDLDDEE